jgi:excisionase family DNA binding protein
MEASKVCTIAEVCAVARVGRSTLYKAISAGNLRAMKIGRRTYIRAADLNRWLEGMPSLVPKQRPPSEMLADPSAIVQDNSKVFPRSNEQKTHQ